jgi:hypothetical protein
MYACLTKTFKTRPGNNSIVTTINCVASSKSDTTQLLIE